jgi:hypothetical protein
VFLGEAHIMPNLPTDNLYKFIAIFGLILTLFSVYYPFQKVYELGLKTIETKYEILKVKNELDF